MLDALAPADRLLDVGCGGGLLLRDNSDDHRGTPQNAPMTLGDERLAFVEFLVARGGPGDLDAAQHELDLVKAELEATPDGWEFTQVRELRELHTMGLVTGEALKERLEPVREEAERRRAEWLGEAAEASEDGT